MLQKLNGDLRSEGTISAKYVIATRCTYCTLLTRGALNSYHAVHKTWWALTATLVFTVMIVTCRVRWFSLRMGLLVLSRRISKISKRREQPW